MWLGLWLACADEPPPEPPPPPLTEVAAPADAEPIVLLEDYPTYGTECRDRADCVEDGKPGWCFCKMPMPKGGSETVGLCWNGKVKTGGKWWCTVEGGRAIQMGVIFPD
jgi:hypothetical protein